jgi:single-stranded-DNA-specific exonuclease
MWVKKKFKKRPNDKDDFIKQLGDIRGIENIDRFLNPTDDDLHSPYLLKNIEIACNRITETIDTGQKITISYDSDMDGVSAGTIMYKYLINLTRNVHIAYHQRSDGHGVGNQFEMIDDDTSLLIIVDSSTNDVEACKELTKKGIDIVILDHHDVEKENPYAIIVNPQQSDCRYPNKNICGAGVTYKALQVLDDLNNSDYADDNICLVGIGTVADVMDLSVLENRRLVMKAVQNFNNIGLIALLKKLKVNKATPTSFGFSIAPQLNGVMRMNNIELAINLLLAEDEDEIKSLIKAIVTLNEEKKRKEQELINMYKSSIIDDCKFVFAIGEESSKSFNGSVAQNLLSEYNKPSLVLRSFDGKLSGSFRGEIKSFLENSGLVISVAGHQGAGGVELLEENLEELKTYINKNFVGTMDKKTFYDIEVNAKDVTMELAQAIEKFNYITGNGHQPLKLRIDGLIVTDERNKMGKDPSVYHYKIPTDKVDLVKFKTTEDFAEEVDLFDKIDVIGQLNINSWYNSGKKQMITTLQVFLDEYKIM